MSLRATYTCPSLHTRRLLFQVRPCGSSVRLHLRGLLENAEVSGWRGLGGQCSTGRGPVGITVGTHVPVCVSGNVEIPAPKTARFCGLTWTPVVRGPALSSRAAPGSGCGRHGGSRALRPASGRREKPWVSGRGAESPLRVPAAPRLRRLCLRPPQPLLPVPRLVRDV